MTYFEYEARKIVDQWVAQLPWEKAVAVTPLMRQRMQQAIVTTWEEERDGLSGEVDGDTGC
jgi:hypothetical protein